MSFEKPAYSISDASDDHQVLVTPRFNLAWSPKAVEARGADTLEAFQVAFGGMLTQLKIEADPNAAGPADRSEMLLAFATIMGIDGSSVTYNDRNTRYTNVAGILMSEPIEAGLPMDDIPSQGTIANPLNYPGLK